MDDIGFCPQCGKVLDRSFRFCPSCGSQQRPSDSWQELFEECLAPLERQEKDILLNRILVLNKKIDSLDEEIHSFIQSKSTLIVR